MDAKAGPLHGRLILDCSALLPGPFLGKLLAARGARVLKVESPNRPDPVRTLGPFYEDLNDCKEIVRLDLKDPKDRAKFHGLVTSADGLIEGFRPAAKVRLGLDEKSLHAVNPKLCIASLVGYPENGARREHPGHDVNFQATTGCLSLFGEMPALPLADLFAAYSGALGMVAALDAVARGASGRRIVVSMTDGLEEVQSGLFRQFKKDGVVPAHGTTLFSGKFPCYRIYASRDARRIAVGAIEPKFWDAMCEVLGVQELAGSGMASGERGDEVAAKIQTAFAKHDWKHWAPLFSRADCCVEAVLNYNEVTRGGL